MAAGRTTLARQCGQRRRLRVLGDQQAPWARATATGARLGSYAQGSQVQPLRALASGGAGVSPWPRQWTHASLLATLRDAHVPRGSWVPEVYPRRRAACSLCGPSDPQWRGALSGGVGVERWTQGLRVQTDVYAPKQEMSLPGDALEPQQRAALLTATREGPGAAVKTPHNTDIQPHRVTLKFFLLCRVTLSAPPS